MNKQEIMELLNIGENREVEFKESYKKLPKSLWKLIHLSLILEAELLY